MRRTVYRDEVAIVSIGMLRAMHSRRKLRAMTETTIQSGIAVCRVKLERVPGVGMLKHRMHLFFVCPRCSSKRRVLGCIDKKWCCRACVPWSTRPRQAVKGAAYFGEVHGPHTATRAPHLKTPQVVPVQATPAAASLSLSLPEVKP
jgi:hypothetical protein